MGKVHGSLTRAGKVRKQTPKVEKKRKNKKIQSWKSKEKKNISKEICLLEMLETETL